ncbi:MAG TPA: hypothetical protein VKB19_01250 [Pedobacter sp.]|nr:hypothetical protein [Pedobacter sp.]
MEKKRLSANIFNGAYICAGVVIAISLIIYSNQHKQDVIIAASLFLLIALALAYFFSKAKTVEFDSDFMYISKGQNTESIALGSVIGIKATMMKINREDMWKIKYKDAYGKVDSVRLLPRNKTFEAFKRAVIHKNPHVEMRSEAKSFDFDVNVNSSHHFTLKPSAMQQRINQWKRMNIFDKILFIKTSLGYLFIAICFIAWIYHLIVS